MTEILQTEIHDDMAWTGDDITKADVTFDLSSANVAALQELAERTRDMPMYDIGREHTGHKDLDADLKRIYEFLIRGRGLAVVRNFPVDLPLEQVERIYWIFCTHFGYLVSNNSLGERLVRVQSDPLRDGSRPARGTKSDGELAFHNDAADILSLLFVNRAEQGGDSQFSSGPAAHNAILKEHPEILPILYRGFPHHRRSEQPDDQPDVTPYDVPIFSNVDGRVCINFTYSSIAPALHTLGRELTSEEAHALGILREVLDRQQMEMGMERGEAVMANNFAMCHSRSSFVDNRDDNRRRLLLRAWMETPLEDRRLPIGRQFFHMENKDGRLGYDPVPGREKLANNDYANVSPELAEQFRSAQARTRSRST